MISALVGMCAFIAMFVYLHKAGAWEGSDRYAEWCNKAWTLLRGLALHIWHFDYRAWMCKQIGHLHSVNLKTGDRWCSRCKEVLNK